MDKLLLYKDWLESFRRDVESELDRMRKAPEPPPAPAVKPVEEAAAVFRAWWDRSYEDPTASEPLMPREENKELALSRKEVAALREELGRARGQNDESFPSLNERVRELVAEKAHLEEQLAAALREIAALKGYRDLKAELDQELGGLRLRMSAIRGEYEARIKLLQEQLESLERRNAGLQAESRDDRERRLAAEKEVAAQRGRLAEAEALRAELHAVRGEVDSRLSAAAEFLEAKIRGVQDQNKGQALQLRELVEALRRLGPG